MGNDVMNVTDKKQIERVVKYLKNATEQEKDWSQRSALINVCSVLEQAVELYEEDDLHPHLLLEIVKAPTILDQAIQECCTTECIHARKGVCQYLSEKEKQKCQRVAAFLCESC